MAAPDPNESASPLDGAPRLRRARRLLVRLLAVLGVGLGLCVAAYVALLVFLNSDFVHQEVLSQIHERLPESLAHFEFGDTYGVDWLGRVRLGPLKVSSASKGRPFASVEEIFVRPSYTALLHGKARPARIVLRRVQLETGSRDDIKRLVDRLRDRPTSGGKRGDDETSSSVALVFEELVLGRTGPKGFETAYGPLSADLRYSREPTGRSVKGRAFLPGDGTAGLEASLSKGAPVTLTLEADDLKAVTLPDFITSRLPVRMERGTLGGKLRIEAPTDFTTGTAEGNLFLRGGFVRNERLSAEPVGPLDLSVETTLRWNRAKQKAELPRLRLSLGKEPSALHVLADADVSFVGDRPFRFDAHTEPLAYPKLLAALPPQLVPGPEIPRPDGPLSATAKLSGDLKKPQEWKVDVKLDLAAFKKVARDTPFYLAGPFQYEPQESVGPPRKIWVGDKNPDFIPFDQLPEYVYRAVTCSEDRFFFSHQGFDFVEMKESFVEAAEKKRLRGASTMSQQLAKNLFLSRERTFSRKAKEALLTVLLESALSKQRLFEIYLNIIEWGPNLYGIGEAARFYFGVDARHLTVKQAVYLATIIPSPIRTYVFFDKGAINDVWEERIRTVLGRMRDDGVITEEQYAQAEAEPLLFRPKDEGGGQGAPSAPP